MVAQTCALHESWDLAKYGFVTNPARLYERWLVARAQDAYSVFLVAEREAQNGKPSKVVGFIVGTTEPEIGIYRLQEYGFMQDLWVEPESRHEGIARQLLQQAIEQFRQIGVKQVRLDVATPNEPARRLFESCGFRAATCEMLLELTPVEP
jgi:ribosomal protein S18 acetylase RimI-like enzyme